MEDTSNDFIYRLKNENPLEEGRVGKSIPLIHFIVSPKVIEVSSEENNTDESTHKWKDLEILTNVSIIANEDSEDSENCPIADHKNEGTVKLSNFLVDHNLHREWKSSRRKTRKPLSSHQLNNGHIQTTTPIHFGSPRTVDHSTNAHFSSHIFLHSKHKIVKCNNIPNNFDHQSFTNKVNQQNLNRTNVSYLKSVKLKCAVCDFTTRFNNSLKKHVSLAHGKSELSSSLGEVKDKLNIQVSNLLCSRCEFSTNNDEDLKQHRLDIHVNRESEKLTEKESVSLTNKYASSGHKIYENHTEIKDFKCILCDFQSKYRSNMRRHELVHSKIEALRMSLKNQGMNMRKKILRCAKCGFCTRLTQNLVIHELKHSPLNSFDSKVERKASNSEGEKGFCLLCQSTSCNCNFVPCTKNQGVKTPMKTIEDKSETPLSNMTFPSSHSKGFQSKLLTPPRTIGTNSHKKGTIESKHSQSQCSSVSPDKSSLSSHKSNSHPKSQCKQSKLNKYSNYFNKSNSTDISLTLFNCTFCAYSSPYKSNTVKHMKTHKHTDFSSDVLNEVQREVIKLFKCSFCAYVSKWKSNTNKHEKKHKSKIQISNSYNDGEKDKNVLAKTSSDDSNNCTFSEFSSLNPIQIFHFPTDEKETPRSQQPNGNLG